MTKIILLVFFSETQCSNGNDPFKLSYLS